MVQTREETTDADGTLSAFGYGAWMNYNAFAADAALIELADGSSAVLVAGTSFGDATGSPPVSGSATWTGVMIGADVERDIPVQSDAAITVDFAEITADVSFTDIINLDAGENLGAMTWSNLSIDAD